MQTILLVGLDSTLLRTRAAVLSRTRARTVVLGVREALAMEEWRRVDLVVLCHTLPDVVCCALTRMFHERSAAVRVLRVLRFGQEEIERCEPSPDGVSSSRPDCLLKTATELLGRVPAPPIEISRWKASLYVQ